MLNKLYQSVLLLVAFILLATTVLYTEVRTEGESYEVQPTVLNHLLGRVK